MLWVVVIDFIMTVISTIDSSLELGKAVRDWEAILGMDAVITDSASLIDAEQTTFACRNRIQAILFPQSTEQVQEVLRVANRFGTPIYPISQGKNWGLGSKVPVESGGVVMDLSRMNKIVDFDEEMAYVTLQPGVTFQQLFEFLESKDSGLMMDSIATTPGASIVGNTMERGQGTGPLADRFAHTSGMTVVLPQGELVHTGYAGYDKSVLGPLAKWGVGPYVDGLFTQSNLGVVTEMTLWLRPKAAVFQSFIAYLEDDDALVPFADTMRKLRLSGLGLSIRIFDDYRLMSTVRQFPFAEAKEDRPLSPALRNQIREELGGLGKWIALGGLYSRSEAYAVLEAQEVREVFAPLSKHFVVFNEDTIARKDFDGLSFQLPQLEQLYHRSMLRGYPSEATMKMVYWRKRGAMPANPEPLRDRCGLLWFFPTLPCKGKVVHDAAQLIESTCSDYGFETNLGFLMLTERTIVIIGGLVFDRDQRDEDERAFRCHNELLSSFIERGWSPHRLGIQSMDRMQQADAGLLQLMRSLKADLDPNGILAPGRYQSP